MSDGAAAGGRAARGRSHVMVPGDARHWLDALILAWGHDYDDIWFRAGTGWGAHHYAAAANDIVTAPTAGDLDRVIRADWQRRHRHR